MSTNRPPASSPAIVVPPARARILRIGVLLGGKIVEERLVRERIPVSIGQSMNNTFSIPVDGLPLQFTLFAVDQGRYYLRFLDKMDGRLSDGGSVFTVDQLKAKGKPAEGGFWQIALGEGSRGKLTLGDLTVLFQFVTEPPRQPKPMLPASVRGTFADRFDPRLLVILAVSLMANFTIVLIALLGDVDLDTDADRAYEQTFKQDTFDVSIQDKPKPVEQAAAPGPAEPVKPAEKVLPTKQPPAPKPDDGGRKDTHQTTISDQQETAFINALVGDTAADGKTDQDMSNRRPASSLNQQVVDARESGRTASAGGNSGRGSRGNGDPRVGTGNGPALNGPGGTDSAGGGKVAESGPSGRISVSDKKSFDDSTLGPDVVLSKIMAAYMAGLKRCYKDYLKKDASARGKVSLEFSVNATGRLTDGKASGVADEVSSCIQGQMALWRFPVPKDKDGEATTAGFAITLQLVPD
jgi:outer membrane biosynthesis protein TonB